jgi:hypothetical protein
MSEQSLKLNPVNNYFIDNYLNYLNRKLESYRKHYFIDYIIISIYLFNVFKNILLLFKKFDYETRILVFDVSLFVGGVEKYNKLILLLINIMGIRLNKILYFTESKKLLNWTQLFEMIRGSIPPSSLGLDMSHREVITKFCKRATLLYRMLNISLLIYSKSIFI